MKSVYINALTNFVPKIIESVPGDFPGEQTVRLNGLVKGLYEFTRDRENLHLNFQGLIRFVVIEPKFGVINKWIGVISQQCRSQDQFRALEECKGNLEHFL